jgi:ABC-type glycerol-3-phosphate transport system permease component
MGQAENAAIVRRGRRSIRIRHGVPEILVTALLVALAVLIILPMIIPFMFVFKTQMEYNYHPWSLPEKLNWINFEQAWKAVRIDQGLLNTILVSLGAIATTIPPAALAGYIFARYRSKVTEFAFYAILIGYFVPAQMVLIPLYKMEVAFKIKDTLVGLFLPMAAFGIPFWVLIYRSFFATLPMELSEAARIDGAGHSYTFFKVMLPLANPATALALLLVFIGAWSDYLLSLILLSSSKNFTMQLRVASFLYAYGPDRMPKYAAAAVIAMMPTVILYVIGHKWIIQGTVAGAVKE